MLTGRMGPDATFGSIKLNSSGPSDMFVVSMSASNGSVLWAQRFGGVVGGETAKAIAFSSSGNVLVAGTYNVTSTISFPGYPSFNASGINELFVAEFFASNGSTN